jgi:hypothetical protein
MIKHLLHLTRDSFKTYALGTSYEEFTFIKVYVSKSRTGARQQGKTRKQGSNHCPLALNSQWRAATPSCPSCSQWRAPYSPWRVGAGSTCNFVVLNQKSSIHSVPRHMASLVIIGNLKNILEASIHKYRKHSNEKGQ